MFLVNIETFQWLDLLPRKRIIPNHKHWALYLHKMFIFPGHNAMHFFRIGAYFPPRNEFMRQCFFLKLTASRKEIYLYNQFNA